MKNKLFNEDGSIFVATNLLALLDTFTIEELESLFVLNKYYHELNLDLIELVELGYLVDVNKVGYEKSEHIKTIKIIEDYIIENHGEKTLREFSRKIVYDWRDKKPKNLKRR